MTTALTPAPETLVDHSGAPRPWLEMPLTYEQARLGMAFHEAGHAVMAMAYGMHVVSSKVTAWEPEPGMWAVTGSTDHRTYFTPPWRYAAQAAAGELAHVTYLMVYGLWTPERAAACAADHDREQAIDTLADYGFSLARDHVPAGGKSWGMVRGIARRKVTRLWREIRTVAHAMDENAVLTGAEIAAMTGLVNAPLAGGAR